MFTTAELIKRFKFNSRQAFLKYIREHLNELNATGMNAIKTRQGWNFTDEAVRILDGLRGHETFIVQQANSETINELNNEINKLKSHIVALLAENNATLKQLAASEAENKKLTQDTLRLTTSSQTLKEQLSIKDEELTRLKNRNLLQRILNKD